MKRDNECGLFYIIMIIIFILTFIFINDLRTRFESLDNDDTLTIQPIDYKNEGFLSEKLPTISDIIQSKYNIVEKEVQTGRLDPMSGFNYNLEITNDADLKYWIETKDAYEKIDSINIEIIELIKSNRSFVLVLINGNNYNFNLGQQTSVDDVSITLITLQDKLIVFRLEYAKRFRDKVFIGE